MVKLWLLEDEEDKGDDDDTGFVDCDNKEGGNSDTDYDKMGVMMTVMFIMLRMVIVIMIRVMGTMMIAVEVMIMMMMYEQVDG